MKTQQLFYSSDFIEQKLCTFIFCSQHQQQIVSLQYEWIKVLMMTFQAGSRKVSNFGAGSSTERQQVNLAAIAPVVVDDKMVSSDRHMPPRLATAARGHSY